MKTHLKKLIGTVVLGLVLFANSIPTWAGQKSLPEVTIGTYSASGSMMGARYSGDTKQFIGCFHETAYGASVTCSAQDKTGKLFICTKNDPRWATVVKSITDSSVVYFEALSSGGSCNTLIIENFSSHLK